jgi:hypothetical protein
MSPICSHIYSITVTELRSTEPAEDWSRCYVHNVAFVVSRP